MKRNSRLKTIGVLILMIGALVFIRLGPWPSVFEQGVALVTGVTGRVINNTLLPYGDKERLKKDAAAERERAMRLLRENAHLKQELKRLGFAKKVRRAQGGVVARVVGRDPAAWYHRVIVDQGAGAGLRG